MYLWKLAAEDCRIDLTGLAQRAGAQILLRQVMSIDAASKRVALDHGERLARVLSAKTGYQHVVLPVRAGAGHLFAPE